MANPTGSSEKGQLSGGIKWDMNGLEHQPIQKDWDFLPEALSKPVKGFEPGSAMFRAMILQDQSGSSVPER